MPSNAECKVSGIFLRDPRKWDPSESLKIWEWYGSRLLYKGVPFLGVPGIKIDKVSTTTNMKRGPLPKLSYFHCNSSPTKKGARERPEGGDGGMVILDVWGIGWDRFLEISGEIFIKIHLDEIPKIAKKFPSHSKSDSKQLENLGGVFLGPPPKRHKLNGLGISGNFGETFDVNHILPAVRLLHVSVRNPVCQTLTTCQTYCFLVPSLPKSSSHTFSGGVKGPPKGRTPNTYSQGIWKTRVYVHKAFWWFMLLSRKTSWYKGSHDASMGLFGIFTYMNTINTPPFM